MSFILYYSKHCANCQRLLQELRNHPPTRKIHYLPVDNRVKKTTGTFLSLANGEEVALPPNVQSVPALLQLEKGCQVVLGNAISDLLLPKKVTTLGEVQASHTPDSYTFSSSNGGVTSDVYSFLDQSAEELQAKGEGGMRQVHHYAGLNYEADIRTPPDTWAPNKVDADCVGKLEAERSSLGPK